MIDNPKIPMIPEEVPPQTGQNDIKLVPRPKSFQGICNYMHPMNEKDHPSGSPRNVEYLGSVEWAWGPGHDRLDSYYLNPRGKYLPLGLR